MTAKQDEKAGGVIAGIVLLALLGGWLAIPSTPAHEINGFHVASLTFTNGILDGWADDVAAWLFNQEKPWAEQEALASYAHAILKGRAEYPKVDLVFNIMGAIFSVGGLVALWLARAADGPKQAFLLGFFAEVIEGAVFVAGEYATIGRYSMSSTEVVLTLVLGVFMGFVAIFINDHHKRKLIANK